MALRAKTPRLCILHLSSLCNKKNLDQFCSHYVYRSQFNYFDSVLCTNSVSLIKTNKVFVDETRALFWAYFN